MSERTINILLGVGISFIIIVVLWFAYNIGHLQGAIDATEGRIECEIDIYKDYSCHEPRHRNN